MRQAFRRLGFNPSKSELEELLGDNDTDGDGSIDFAEFVAMMARTRG